MSSKFIYYVYAFINHKTGLPYYIGKGKGRRAYSKRRGISVPNDRSKIIICESNLSEVGALALERRYIKWFGRKDNNTGILLNRTDGGDGLSGRVVSIEERSLRSIKFTGTGNHRFGKKVSEETKQKNRSWQLNRPKISDETREKLSTAQTGRVHSIESRYKRSEKMKLKSKILVCRIRDRKVMDVGNFTKYP